MTDEPKPWERQPYDTQASWSYFQLYLEQDPPRSINAAYKKYRVQKGYEGVQIVKAPGQWQCMAAGRYRNGNPIPGAMTWEQRALAWDDHLASLERLKWVERRLNLKEKEWEVAQKLLDKAQQMLMFPVVAQESADGKTIIMPAGWKFRDLPSVVAAASKLARLAAEMSTENVTVDWREEARKAGIDDPDGLFRTTVEQFERQLAGKDAEGSLPNGSTEPGENQ